MLKSSRKVVSDLEIKSFLTRVSQVFPSKRSGPCEVTDANVEAQLVFNCVQLSWKADQLS